jgi:hypothetical protein
LQEDILFVTVEYEEAITMPMTERSSCTKAEREKWLLREEKILARFSNEELVEALVQFARQTGSHVGESPYEQSYPIELGFIRLEAARRIILARLLPERIASSHRIDEYADVYGAD